MNSMMSAIGLLWIFLKTSIPILKDLVLIVLSVLSLTKYGTLHDSVHTLLQKLGIAKRANTIFSHIVTAGLYSIVVVIGWKTFYSLEHDPLTPADQSVAAFQRAQSCIDRALSSSPEICNADSLKLCLFNYTYENGVSTSDKYLKSLQERAQQELDSDRCRKGTPSKASDDQTWLAAKRANTVEAFEDYINEYPSGVHAPDAKKYLEDLKALIPAKDERAWTAAQQFATLEAYENYLTAFPSGAHASDSRGRIENLKAAEAKALAATKDERAWTTAQQFGTVEAYENYLTAFPSGAHASDSTGRIEDLKAAEAKALAVAKDERAWTTAQQFGTIEAYENYLAAFPTGAHASDSRRRIQDLKATEAKALAAAKDERAWTTAQQFGTVEAYENYLTAFPSGAHVFDAQTRIADLKPDARIRELLKKFDISFAFTYSDCLFDFDGRKIELHNGEHRLRSHGTLRLGDDNKLVLVHDKVQGFETIVADLNQKNSNGKTLYNLGETINGREIIQKRYLPYTASVSINAPEIVLSYSWDFSATYPAGTRGSWESKRTLGFTVASENECHIAEAAVYDYNKNETNPSYQEMDCGPKVMKQTCKMAPRNK